ncbi:MAG TPA: AraC family transcriptional regulator, partial [Chryseolinea sp.]|nr:AraC family transcriptional regulator [Chryseolinea sp.]
VHTWTFSKNADGWVIFFTRAFYDMQLSQNSLLEFPFYHSLVSTPVVQPSKTEALKFVVRQMYEEYKSADTPNPRILRSYLDIFLLEAAKYLDSSIKAVTHGNTFKIRKLEQFIDENFKKLRQPSDYGDIMNLAPSYLNSICKDSLGKTLTQLIQGRLLLEAKRLFAYSDMNVNEIASSLNFTDPSYFVRWFRKLNGNTPEEFRNSI